MENKWIFGLDAQLVADTILLAVSIFILFVVLSYVFFNPTRDFLERRSLRIREDLDSAQKDRTDAANLKSEYDAKLKEVNKEADDILSEARKRAVKQENRMLEEAKEEAARMLSRASQAMELEKKQATDEVRREMIQIASRMAGKAVGAVVNVDVQDKLIDETLREIGDETWMG